MFFFFVIKHYHVISKLFKGGTFKALMCAIRMFLAWRYHCLALNSMRVFFWCCDANVETRGPVSPGERRERAGGLWEVIHARLYSLRSQESIIWIAPPVAQRQWAASNWNHIEFNCARNLCLSNIMTFIFTFYFLRKKILIQMTCLYHNSH